MAHKFGITKDSEDFLASLRIKVGDVILNDNVECKTSCTSGNTNNSYLIGANKDDTERMLLQNLADDYRKKAEKINSVLKKAGLNLESYPMDFQEQVNNIAELAVVLKVEDPSPTSLLLGSIALQNGMKLEEEEGLQIHTMSKLTKRMQMVAKLIQDLQKSLDDQQNLVNKFEKAEGDIKSETQYFERKCQDYVKDEQKLQTSMKEVGVEKKLYHGELVKDANELKKQKEKLSILTSKLKSYQDLPPDTVSAQKKLDEAVKELRMIEKKFDECSKQHFGKNLQPKNM